MQKNASKESSVQKGAKGTKGGGSAYGAKPSKAGKGQKKAMV